MKVFRVIVVLVGMSLLSSCVMLRQGGPTGVGGRVSPGEPQQAGPGGEPEAAPKALAPGDARITVVADDVLPAFRLFDADKEMGMVRGGESFQWDRPAGVVDVTAVPVKGHARAIRFVGLFVQGEHQLPLGIDTDGTLAFLGSKTARLSEARRISRLRYRAQRLPLHLAMAYLEERLFSAPAPGRLRSAYADADQAIVQGREGPALTWSRFDVRGGHRNSGENGGAQHSRSMTCAFADFVDVDLRLGVTTRVAFRRAERDTEPARAFFRMSGGEGVDSKLESLLVALMVCCRGE